MKCRALVVSVILIGAASAPAAAQIKLDMNKITCGNWLGYGSADRDFVRYFMSGYYNAAANNNVLDYDRLQKNSEKLSPIAKSTNPTGCQPPFKKAPARLWAPTAKSRPESLAGHIATPRPRVERATGTAQPPHCCAHNRASLKYVSLLLPTAGPNVCCLG
ncbi:HdeA/HdeB family chaperone [Bradyrhizobium japonicum]|uniref:HdeA/HdeB family chaperone n=2 Tax=Bradyrhizobium TaxID=374 RepID=UPI00209DAB0C|nr:HdeA/HdeB family chaperone [Bradyrhizobium japonicum]